MSPARKPFVLALVLASSPAFLAHAEPVGRGARISGDGGGGGNDAGGKDTGGKAGGESTVISGKGDGSSSEPVEDVPDDEKSARTQEHLARMREILKGALAHLEEARDQDDVIKLNCVNEKVVDDA